MSFDARITRRSALVFAASLLLAGCAPAATDGSAPAGSMAGSAAVSDAGPAWEATLDAEAPFLNVEGQEGAAMPGDLWTQLDDGTIQVQVAGSSIPEPAVDRVDFADGVLTLTMAVPDENTPATMDLVLHQFMVKPVDKAEVKTVKLIRGSDEVELARGVVAPAVELAE